MIDTMTLRFPTFKITDEAPLIIEGPRISASTGAVVKGSTLWRTESGNEVEGTKACYKGDNYHVNVYGSDRGGAACCSVQFSLPKLLNGCNYAALSIEECKRAVKELESQLLAAGITVSLDEAQLSRLDLFRNAVTDEPYCCYSSLLSRLQGKRQHKSEFGTTFLWRNATWSLVAYDKRAEMKRRGDCVSSTAPHTMRLECQLKRKRLRSVGLAKLADLWDKFEELPRIYSKLLSKSIFHNTISVPDLVRTSHAAASELESEMRVFREEAKGNWLPKYLQAEGMSSLNASAGESAFLAAFTNILSDEDGTPTAKKKRISRFKRDLIDKAFRLDALRAASPSERTMGAVYQELQDKFVLAA